VLANTKNSTSTRKKRAPVGAAAQVAPAGRLHGESMRAAQIMAPQQAKVVEAPIPIVGTDQLLVRVEGCGLCGSNLPVWEGRDWFTYPLPPGNPGHEGWGQVVTPPQNNPQGLRTGDRVAMLSYQAFAEYDVAGADAVVKLPSVLDGKPFPAEPLACAFNVFARSDLRAGQKVAIVGIGFLGALLTALAVEAGAEVIAISRRPFALEIARGYGAAHTIPMDDHWRIIEQVKQLTADEGCDCVIEAVGAQWPLDLAAELTKIRGRLLIAGYHQDGPRQVNMQLWNWRGLDVINAHERDPAVYAAGMRAAVEAVAAGRLDPSPLYTHQYSLDQLDEAFTVMQTRPDGFFKALVLA
jgi:threonine dehydrogenase-like Zn-dependent dehydrogenase